MVAADESSQNSMIPVRLKGVTGVAKQVFLAAIAGLGLRLVFVLGFPASAGDSGLYLQLARNWAVLHNYGLWINGQLVPTDLRMPGYPAFLWGVALLFGRGFKAILLSQAAMDLCTCVLTGLLASVLAPAAARRRAALAAIWLAATCPFVANYSAVVLTEVLAAFLSTAACLCLALCVSTAAMGSDSNAGPVAASSMAVACLGAFLTGVASLVRPEMPLLAATAGVVVTLRWQRNFGWSQVARLIAAMGAAFLLPLAVWGARNLRSASACCWARPTPNRLGGTGACVRKAAPSSRWSRGASKAPMPSPERVGICPRIRCGGSALPTSRIRRR